MNRSAPVRPAPTIEHLRLASADRGEAPWRRWGAYLSERQWGTVREDYSSHGSAWDYLPHDHARSRAYRWGEDGLLGISDNQQLLCFSIALWNGRDPILKERLFGLIGSEGNHGEDVKELYYYLDGTPTHSYLRGLYKYPQAEYPYARLVEENRRRDKREPEFELLDTGVFDESRYFDIQVEYAKADTDDVLIRITASNRGPDAATLHLVPQLWFRNTWSWDSSTKPVIEQASRSSLRAKHAQLGTYNLEFIGADEVLFTENETNGPRLFRTNDAGPFKDAFHERIVDGREDSCGTDRGTKAGLVYRLAIGPGQSRVVRLRLSRVLMADPFARFDAIVRQRIEEADAFYEHVQRGVNDTDARHVQRQAFAGMIWSQQFFHIDVERWLKGDPSQPAPPHVRRHGRNRDWEHLNTADIVSMPDKWEYPWFAAWDLAFHCIPLAQIDPGFAKGQLVLLTREWLMHPSGQMPAYEWAYGDVNPPVHAWAAWRVYEIDQARTGVPDTAFLERVFHKLLLNFTWWVNRKDAEGRNLFQGGFLGLDNIGVFDRSAPLPTGGHISQADGTSWMAMYALNLMRIALELATHNPVYQDVATKFFEHFLHIAAAMSNIAGEGIDLWCDRDEFFYDVLCLPDGRHQPLKVRSMVGLIPLFAVEVLDSELLAKVPEFRERLEWLLAHRPDLAKLVSRWEMPGMKETRLLSLLRGHRLKCLLRRMLDESEFLSDYGVRALSKVHAAERSPYCFNAMGMDFRVTYQPGESDSGLFGGNSNWRGPIWMPTNFLLVESLRQFRTYYGDDFKVECPTGSGVYLTLNEVADELTRRLTRLVLRDENGRRAVFGDNQRLQTDEHFRDHVLFYEYFHGDTGRGVGASHQTGWTGLLATLLMSAASGAPGESRDDVVASYA
ncbi:MAG: hypothetical protein QM770_04930 [Tepidisphaeraceae bacterium]